MTAAGFDPWRGVERLPDHAPFGGGDPMHSPAA